MTKKKKTKPAIWPETRRNKIRLKLLLFLPEFQKDVRQIRNMLWIPEEGYSSDKQSEDWDDEFFEKRDRQGVRSIYAALEIVGKKYRLPRNFYHDMSEGLWPYILRNEVLPPANNWVIALEERDGPEHISIKTFAPLSKREIAMAKKDLSRMQKHFFRKEIMVPTRIKANFERDLEIYSAFRERVKKPVRKKMPDIEGYMLDFDEKTSQQIGETFGITAAAARQAARRISKLIRDFFGQNNIRST